MEEVKSSGTKFVMEGIRQELQKMISDGDLTPEILVRVIQVAKSGRDLLMSLSTKAANVGSVLLGNMGLGFGSTDTSNSQMASVPMAYSSPQENFGMTAVREIISTLKDFNQKKPSLSETVKALAVAREEGLHDVARELEAQLVNKKEPEQAPQEKKLDEVSA